MLRALSCGTGLVAAGSSLLWLWLMKSSSLSLSLSTAELKCVFSVTDSKLRSTPASLLACQTHPQNQLSQLTSPLLTDMAKSSSTKYRSLYQISEISLIIRRLTCKLQVGWS